MYKSTNDNFALSFHAYELPLDTNKYPTFVFHAIVLKQWRKQWRKQWNN